MPQIDKIERIGKVLVKQIKIERANRPTYSDGSVENELLQRFKSNNDYGKRTGNKKFASWAHEYHLSPVRHNLLKWYPFNPDGSVLEVGAGCGALTGLLCSQLKKVTALEYSYRRALVTAQRHSSCSNLEVVVGGFRDYEAQQLFDYITVIGVLEYAATFYGGEKPFESFLKKVCSILKPDGALVLAIENKIGLKYVAGAPEDHTGRVFESIYDYCYPTKVRTFSKQEMARLLEAAGFVSVQWYYPLPDYKRPQIVISEEVVPKKTDSLWRLYPVKTSVFLSKVPLAERWFGQTLAQAGLFGEFSNSFLVIAKKTKAPDKSRCIRFWAANRWRRPELRTNVRITVDAEGKSVIRSAENDESVPFIREVAQRELLAEKFFKGKAEVVRGRFDGSSLRYSFIEYPSLYELVADAIEKGDTGFGKSWLEKYKHFLEALPRKDCVPEQFMREFNLPSREITQSVKCLTCSTFDCVPQNIRISPHQKWYIIDNEWTSDYPLPIDYLVFRGILTLIVGLQSYFRIYLSENQPLALFRGYGKHREYIPLSWVEILRTLEIPLPRLMRWEQMFQNRININQRNLGLRLGKKPKVFTHLDICRTSTNWGTLHRLKHLLSNRTRVFRITL